MCQCMFVLFLFGILIRMIYFFVLPFFFRRDILLLFVWLLSWGKHGSLIEYSDNFQVEVVFLVGRQNNRFWKENN